MRKGELISLANDVSAVHETVARRRRKHPGCLSLHPEELRARLARQVSRSRQCKWREAPFEDVQLLLPPPPPTVSHRVCQLRIVATGLWSGALLQENEDVIRAGVIPGRLRNIAKRRGLMLRIIVSSSNRGWAN